MPYQVDFFKRVSKSLLKAKFVEEQIKKRQSKKLRGLLALTFSANPKRLQLTSARQKILLSLPYNYSICQTQCNISPLFLPNRLLLLYYSYHHYHYHPHHLLPKLSPLPLPQSLIWRLPGEKWSLIWEIKAGCKEMTPSVH